MKRKNDLILIAVIVVIAAAGFIFYSINKKETGPQDKVQILINASLYKEVNLNEDQTIEITEDGEVKNVVEIKDNKVSVIEANCPDQVCIHQKTIEKDGEMIICLPNKVVVTIVGSEASDTDSVAN